jgi:hypothetical protein
MTRHNRIPQRKRIFIGCEGESERSYAALLQQLLRGRSAQRDELCICLAKKLSIQLIWQDPCHEAVLLRHLLDCEQRRPPTSRESEEQLKVQWPGYVKNFGKDRLRERIDMTALLRVIRYEPELAVLLKLIKLVQ